MKLFILCGVFLVAFLLTTTTEARKTNGKAIVRAKNSDNSTIECLGQNVSQSKLDYGMSECTQEVVVNLADLVDKPRGRKKALKRNHLCIKLCQRKKQGILNSNGTISESGALGFVENLFPSKAGTRIQRGLLRCAEDHGDGFPVTNNCKDYKRFEKCMTRIITKACGIKNDGRSTKNAARKNGNKGKNKGSNRKQQQSEISDDDHEDSEID